MRSLSKRFLTLASYICCIQLRNVDLHNLSQLVDKILQLIQWPKTSMHLDMPTIQSQSSGSSSLGNQNIKSFGWVFWLVNAIYFFFSCLSYSWNPPGSASCTLIQFPMRYIFLPTSTIKCPGIISFGGHRSMKSFISGLHRWWKESFTWPFILLARELPLPCLLEIAAVFNLTNSWDIR